MPRSGSNYVSDLMAGLDRVWSLREIFQPEGVHAYNGQCAHVVDILEAADGIKPLHSLMREAASHATPHELFRDSRFIRFARSHPDGMLDLIARAAGEALVSFKVFAGHLADQDLVGKVLSRPDVCAVILHRDPIEAFVSMIKGRAVRRYVAVDTTDVTVQLEFLEFLRFLHGTTRFQSAVAEASEKVVPRLSYESMMAVESDATRLGLVVDQVSAATEDRVRLSHPEGAVQTQVKRQDSKRDYARTVENWSEFLARCEGAGLDSRHSRHLGGGEPADPDNRFDHLAAWCHDVHHHIRRERRSEARSGNDSAGQVTGACDSSAASECDGHAS